MAPWRQWTRIARSPGSRCAFRWMRTAPATPRFGRRLYMCRRFLPHPLMAGRFVPKRRRERQRMSPPTNVLASWDREAPDREPRSRLGLAGICNRFAASKLPFATPRELRSGGARHRCRRWRNGDAMEKGEFEDKQQWWILISGRPSRMNPSVLRCQEALWPVRAIFRIPPTRRRDRALPLLR
jgi:hypothetical protein